MLVETYEVEDAAQVVAEPDEWKSKVEALGLTGQVGLCSSTTHAQTSAVPFQPLEGQRERIVKLCCPTSEDLESYASGVIPMRVLALVELCKKEGYFKKMRVWSDKTLPDPFLIGYKERKVQSWTVDDEFLIARWGTELDSWEVMTKRAIERWAADKKAELLEVKDKAESLLKNIEARAERFILTGKQDFIQVQA